VPRVLLIFLNIC